MCKKINIFLLFCCFLTGCVTATPIILPDGSTGYEIKCPGTQRSMGDCMNKARESCGGNYKVVDKEESSGMAFTGYGIMQTRDRSMFVECE